MCDKYHDQFKLSDYVIIASSKPIDLQNDQAVVMSKTQEESWKRTYLAGFTTCDYQYSILNEELIKNICESKRRIKMLVLNPQFFELNPSKKAYLSIENNNFE